MNKLTLLSIILGTLLTITLIGYFKPDTSSSNTLATTQMASSALDKKPYTNKDDNSQRTVENTAITKSTERNDSYLTKEIITDDDKVSVDEPINLKVIDNITNYIDQPSSEEYKKLIHEIQAVDDVKTLYELSQYYLQNFSNESTEVQSVLPTIKKMLESFAQNDDLARSIHQLYYSDLTTSEQRDKILDIDLPLVYKRLYLDYHDVSGQKKPSTDISSVIAASENITVEEFISVSNKLNAKGYDDTDLTKTFASWLKNGDEDNLYDVKKRINLVETHAEDKVFLQNVVNNLERK